MVGLSLNPAPNQALQDLVLLVGDEATKEIVRLFLQSFPESIRDLSAGALQDQVRIAHGLKSSALHMGADQLVQRIGEIEAKLTETKSVLAAGDLEPTTAEFESFAAGLRRYAQA
jgi:HPt (histidine-containing phosphotransfer) domain-containing protein